METSKISKPRVILKNVAECALCGDVIESRYRNEFVRCSCWDDEERTGIFVDGGTDYIRRGAFNVGHIIDRSEYADDKSSGK